MKTAVTVTERQRSDNERILLLLKNKIKDDPNYLLQCCVDYKWKKVYKICRFLLNHHDDDEVTKTTCKKQLLAVDTWGNTPLHGACYFRPPIEIIQCLLEVSSIYQVALITKVNHKGFTPLLVACTCGSSSQVILELLKHYPKAALCYTLDNNGNNSTVFTALVQRYEMLQHIPKYNKQNKKLEDITRNDIKKIMNKIMNVEEEEEEENNDNDNDSSSSSSLSLLGVDDDSSRSNSGSSCCDTTTTDTTNTKTKTKKKKTIRDLSSSSSTMTTDSSFNMSFESFWILIVTILHQATRATRATCCCYDDQDSFSSTTTTTILNNAAYLSELLPPVLSSMIIRTCCCCSCCFFDDHHQDNTTTNTILPLHMAVVNNCHLTMNTMTKETDHHCCLNVLLERRSYFIQELIKQDYPYHTQAAANCINPNTKRLPLFDAIVSKLPWNIILQDEQDEQQDEQHKATGGPLQSIWSANPNALQQYDPITGLKPFMLAAATATIATTATTCTTIVDIEDDEDEAGVAAAVVNSTTIYDDDDDDDHDNDDDDDDDDEQEQEKHNSSRRQQLDTIYSLLRLDPSAILIAAV